MVPTPQKSHLSCLKAVADELVARGHRVHFLYRDDFSQADYQSANGEGFQLVLYHGKIAKSLPQNATYDEVAEILVRLSIDKASRHAFLNMVKDLMESECREILLNSEDTIKPLENEDFDIAVVDGAFLTRCFYLLPFRLHIPWVTYNDIFEPLLVPVPWLTSFVPSALTSFTEKMDFLQRIENTFAEFLMWTGFLATKLPADIDEAYRKYGHFDSLEDLARQSQLFMNSRDIVLDYAKPTMPNIINIGGLTTRPARNLSKDLETFINGSSHGVILATFGSMTNTLPRSMTDNFLTAFGRLEGYRVIWKFANTDNLTIPDNVRLENWVPQQDILGHPKTKLFVTHCGNNGQYEAVYHGVI